jgi:26S proteasome regulatory subunit T5
MLGESEMKMQARLIDNEIKMMRQESVRLSHERQGMMEKISDNATKIKQNKVLPYLVSKVVEVSLYYYNGVEVLMVDIGCRWGGSGRCCAQWAECKEDEMCSHQDIDKTGKLTFLHDWNKLISRLSSCPSSVWSHMPSFARATSSVSTRTATSSLINFQRVRLISCGRVLMAEYDARVKAMEVDERPTETYTDIGGLDKQIEELVEAM